MTDNTVNQICLDSFEQVADLNALGLLRDLQYMSTSTRHQRGLKHCALVHAITYPETSACERAISLNVQLHSHFDDNQKVPPGNIVAFSVEVLPSDMLNSYAANNITAALNKFPLKGGVVDQEVHDKHDLAIRCMLRPSAFDALLSVGRPTNNELEVEVLVELKLAVGHSRYKAQLEALHHAQSKQPDNMHVHAKEFFIGPPTAHRIVDITREFTEGFPNTSEYWQGCIPQQASAETTKTICEELALSKLNDEQIDAARKVLSSLVNGLAFIYGPPGCGKSHTLAVMVVQGLLLHSTATVAAKTNTAAKIICDKTEDLLKYLRQALKLETHFIQVHLRTAATEDLLREMRFLNMKPQNIVNPESSLSWTTYRLASTYRADAQPMLKFRESIEAIERTHNRVDIPYDFWQHTHLIAKDAENHVLAKLVTSLFGTFDSIKLRLQAKHYKGGRSVYLDEASQATVSEALVVHAVMSDVRRLILDGDPKQISPSPSSTMNKLSEVAKLYSSSVFEHPYGRFSPGQRHYLIQNYRCPQAVIDLANRFEYTADGSPMQAAPRHDEDDPIRKQLSSLDLGVGFLDGALDEWN